MSSTTLHLPHPRAEATPEAGGLPILGNPLPNPSKPQQANDQAPQQASEQKFRPDIEGLRAVAVLAVVLYHAGVAHLRGGFVGVDVFFVISGFLITSQLLAEVRATGTVRLRTFWARRARRLLPAVAAMLAATTVAVIALWPALRRATTLTDIAVAAVYGANWRFIATNVEYGATTSRSPVLHLWSLGVEEQFYLVWPLLVLAGVWVARRRGWSVPRTLAVALAAVALGSFAWSWVTSTADPMFAYFSLPTRAWQLGTGALLALAAARVARLASRWRMVLGWLGLAGIAVAILTLVEGEGLAYPGVAALLPTLAAAAVIASGLGSVPRWGPVALLRRAPLQVMGKLSYGWYLWHWPFVVLAPAALDRRVSLLENLALSMAALGVAGISYHLLENPIRHSRVLTVRPLASLALGAALTVLPAILAYSLIGKAASGAVTHTLQVAQQGDDQPASASPGSGSAAGTSRTSRGTTSTATREQTVRLSPLQASKDRGLVSSHCQVGRTGTAPADGCTFGAVNSPQRMVLLGDSHASHWFPALEQVAQSENVALIAWTKSWCQLTDVQLRLNDKPYVACQQWRAEVMRRLRANPPATIVVSGLDLLSHAKQLPQVQVVDPATGQGLRGQQAAAVWQAGYQRMLDQLRSTGAQVIVIADTPMMSHLVPDCLAATGSVPQCSTSREWAVPSGEDARLARAAGVPVWDFTDQICGRTTCSAVNGEHIAWWDAQHMTASFAATLAPQMRELYRTR